MYQVYKNCHCLIRISNDDLFLNIISFMPLLFCKSKKVSVKIDRKSYLPISYLHHYLFSIFHSKVNSHNFTWTHMSQLHGFYFILHFIFSSLVFNPGACSAMSIDRGEFHVKVTWVNWYSCLLNNVLLNQKKCHWVQT